MIAIDKSPFYAADSFLPRARTRAAAPSMPAQALVAAILDDTAVTAGQARLARAFGLGVAFALSAGLWAAILIAALPKG